MRYDCCTQNKGYEFYGVNYRGSLGFGQASIKALKGRCGDVDIKDCLQVGCTPPYDSPYV